MFGKKNDSGKREWSLLPFNTLEDIVKVLEFGAKKYGSNNWQKVENAKERYFDAAVRHLVAWRTGELYDEESGLPHMAHLACNAIFLGWFDKGDTQPIEQSKPKKKKKKEKEELSIHNPGQDPVLNAMRKDRTFYNGRWVDTIPCDRASAD